jgi:hypothetical protein
VPYKCNLIYISSLIIFGYFSLLIQPTLIKLPKCISYMEYAGGLAFGSHSHLIIAGSLSLTLPKKQA